jgi:hypothetical protein
VNLFIKPDSVAVMSILFMGLMALFLTMLLKPRDYYRQVAKRARELGKAEL